MWLLRWRVKGRDVRAQLSAVRPNSRVEAPRQSVDALAHLEDAEVAT
jgi:hypothetical protein